MVYTFGKILAFFLYKFANLITLDNLPPLLCVSVIISNKGKILAINHGDSRGFTLPGGGIKVGESIYEAASREIEEETGYVIRLKRYIGFYERLTGAWFHIPTVALAFEGKIIRGRKQSSAEGIVEWVAPKQIRLESDIIQNYLFNKYERKRSWKKR